MRVVIYAFILAERPDSDSAEGVRECRRCGLLTGSSDADVNEQTKSGMTPLMCAVKVLGPKDGDVIVLRDVLPSVYASEATSEEADSDGCSSDNW